MRKILAVAGLAATWCVSTSVISAPPAQSPESKDAPASRQSHSPAVAGGANATHRPIGGSVKPYESGKINPHLTEEDCTLLGGYVYSGGIATACLSGKVCTTSDETGYEHYVCISKTN